MKRSILVLIASILLAFATIGGLAVFGMDGSGMQMDTGHGSMDCLSHCLGVASSTTAGVVPVTVSTFAFVVLFVLSFLAWQTKQIVWIPSVARWREGIGKRYRQRELAVVRIQD